MNLLSAGPAVAPRRWPTLLPLLAGAALSVVGLSGCETEFDSNDTYRETTVIFAALDPDDSIQTVRISKAFLNGKTSALDIARNHPDSTTFRPETIAAELQWLNADSTLRVAYPLAPNLLTTKEPGVFNYPTQVVYQTPAAMPRLDETAIYRIVVRNLRTGTTASGTTSIPAKPLARKVGTSFLNTSVPANQNLTYNFQPETRGGLGVQLTPRATLYQGELTFHFQEIQGTDTTARALTWTVFPNTIITSEPGTESYPGEYAEGAFFNWLQNNLDVSQDPAGLKRRVVNVTWRLWAGSPQWGTFFQVLNSYSALSQTVPEFTNVRNGRGLVTGRQRREVNATVQSNASRQAFTSRFPNGKFVF